MERVLGGEENAVELDIVSQGPLTPLETTPVQAWNQWPCRGTTVSQAGGRAGRGNPAATCAPESWVCFFSSGNQDEKSEEEEMEKGKLREDRGLISPKGPREGTWCSHSCQIPDRAGSSQGCQPSHQKASFGLALMSLHSCNVQRVLTGRVLVS